jgi:protein transport protein SEC13
MMRPRKEEPIVDLLSIETDDTQHDAVLDYYGRRLATCSSDKTIKIFEVEGESHRLVETLKGYATP